jgi:glucokinase
LATGNNTILSFDIGGGHITAGLVQPDPFSPVRLIRSSISSCREEASFVERCTTMKEALLSSSQVEAISLAFPGPFNYSSGVSLMKHKLSYLHGLPLRSRLAVSLRCSPSSILFCNDAEAFLRGEMAQSFDPLGRSVAVTLGTGVGSAFAENGRIRTKGEGIPKDGEIWNLPWNGAILEDAISGARILEQFRAKSGSRSEEIAEVALAAQYGNVEAISTFADYGHRLGTALGTVFKTFSPSKIFLGGGITKSAKFFLPFLFESLDLPQTDLIVSSNSERSAVLGASLYWKQHMKRKVW